MSDTPTDFLSYADWLGLNQDEIQQAREQMFQQADQAAGEANRLGFDLGLEQQAAGGQYDPQQSVTYGQFMEQQRKAKDLAARASTMASSDEMSPQERAARGLVAAGSKDASAARTDAIGSGLKGSQQWIDSQRALGQRNVKNINWTREQMAKHEASRKAAGPANDETDKKFKQHFRTWWAENNPEYGSWSDPQPQRSLEYMKEWGGPPEAAPEWSIRALDGVPGARKK